MRTDTFDGVYPYAPRFIDAPGFLMHYVDEGPTNGEVVLCLHGEPTWGFFFRHLVTVLRRTHRMVVPDHVGFSKSGTPPSRSYWPQDHIDNLERFVLTLDLRGLMLVMHDFGGPIGMGLASRHSDRMRRIVSVNGSTPFEQATLGECLAANAAVSPWFQWIVRAEPEGRLEAALGEFGFDILSTLKLNGFKDHGFISDAWLQAYGARFATPADYAGAISWARGFATGAHRFELLGAAVHRAIVTKPVMAIWDMADRTLRAEHFLPLFSELSPDAPVYRLPDVGYYNLEDAPDAITDRIATFLAQTWWRRIRWLPPNRVSGARAQAALSRDVRARPPDPAPTAPTCVSGRGIFPGRYRCPHRHLHPLCCGP